MSTLFETPSPGPMFARTFNKTPEISFVVFGHPQPQGSSRAVFVKGHARPFVTSANKKLKPWRQQISETALTLNAQIFDREVPLAITLDFYFDRPKSAKKRRGMIVKPDGDKLQRAIADAIKGILIADDAQIVDWHARKHYGGPERVEIRLQEAM